MNKLLMLKSWLTVPEAAKHMSSLFEEDVTEADVLRLALDHRLQLSVYFVNHAEAKPGKIVPLSTVEKERIKWGTEEVEVTSGIRISPEKAIVLDDTLVRLSGVWDLPMIGNERLDIEHQYQQLTGGPAVTLQGLDGAFVTKKDGQIWQIQEKHDPGERESFYYPAGGLPDDSLLVVRTEALRELANNIAESSASRSKSAETRGRRTLLAIIAALCGHAKIDHNARGTAQRIKEMTETVGAPIDDGTIAKVLREIDDALESRMK